MDYRGDNMGIMRNNGKENEHYYVGFRVRV